MTPTPLDRALSFPQLVLMGVGTIIGAGIYSVIGSVAGLAGRAMWASMLLAAVAAALTALSYAELVSARHRAGAEYQFMRAAFPAWPLLAYSAGFFIALNCVATSAAVALSFAGYLRGFADVPELPAAWLLLAACTALNLAGIRQSAWVGIALIAVEIGGLLLVIALGWGTGEPGAALAPVAAGQAAPIFAGAALVFFAYIGFEDVTNLSEEARRPAIDVPRALLASVAVTAVLYVALVWAVLSVMSPAELAASKAPLADAAARAAPWAAPVVRVAALFATASTALLVLVSIPRLVFAMSREGDFRALLARTSRRRRTPWAAALLLFAGASALVPLGRVEIAAAVSAFGILVAFCGVHAAAIALRLRPAGEPPAFRMPWSVRGVPVPAVLGLAANLLLMTQFTGLVYLLTAGTFGAGLLVYAWMHALRTRRNAAAGPPPAG